MATLERFEELEIWQLAREISLQVYKIHRTNLFRKRTDLRRQMERSAGSVMDNIAEGFERGGTKEFINFLSIAKASCGELRSQLYRALDRNLINQKVFAELCDSTVLESKKISSFISYLSKLDHRGIKYKYSIKPKTKNLKPKT